jgi:hypothetical protein
MFKRIGRWPRSKPLLPGAAVAAAARRSAAQVAPASSRRTIESSLTSRRTIQPSHGPPDESTAAQIRILPESLRRAEDVRHPTLKIQDAAPIVLQT